MFDRNCVAYRLDTPVAVRSSAPAQKINQSVFNTGGEYFVKQSTRRVADGIGIGQGLLSDFAVLHRQHPSGAIDLNVIQGRTERHIIDLTLVCRLRGNGRPLGEASSVTLVPSIKNASPLIKSSGCQSTLATAAETVRDRKIPAAISVNFGRRFIMTN
jgi:hypothetical protein